jgi:cell fate regulator YaaT (PSP1 superfamily)
LNEKDKKFERPQKSDGPTGDRRKSGERTGKYGDAQSEKSPETAAASYPTSYVVRFGVMRTLSVMSCKLRQTLTRGEHVIARSNRGLEIGEVLCEANDHAMELMEGSIGGQILRARTHDDKTELIHIESQRDEKYEVVKKNIENLDLDMQLVEIEQLFGGERIIVYYLSENRVDFRQLVKDLAGEFQTRIEMKQIGVRDEAKLLADYGDCGKPVCCNTHLSKMPPVSMKMAKLQKATLDPTKISGRCGRLKCCLRYEYETYEQIQKELPSIGSQVVTRDGKGRVLSYEILAEQLLLEMEDRRRIMVDASQVLSVISKPSKSEK